LEEGTKVKEQGEVAEATRQANEIFAAVGKSVENALERQPSQVDVLDIARQAGIEELDEAALRELDIPLRIPVLPWLPWHFWFPWRPLWCWWWGRYYPWYGWCCPWYWYRCHRNVLW
jgi:hypothetical protein